ncbi:hypothetical protein [Aeromonas australiensis]|uniref:hypothetical protein n=1 Tax=Aeromonas australiensis TaxID=1114880 RepID=UPI00058A209B|nr:hypothetical protein [Aeromonas australiensis]
MAPTLAQEYRNSLLHKRDISVKTGEDYLAALKQLLHGCVVPDYCTRNPFERLTAGKNPIKRAR